MEEGEQNQGDGQRVEQHQHRDGEFDDGTQADVGEQAGDDGKERGEAEVGNARQDAVEIFGAGGDEADGCGEAGEENDDGQ